MISSRVKLPRFQSFLNISSVLLYFISSIILCNSACNDENLMKIGLYQARSGDFPKNATWRQPDVCCNLKTFFIDCFYLFFFHSLVNIYYARMCEDLFTDLNVIVLLALKLSSHLKDRVVDLIHLKHPLILRFVLVYIMFRVKDGASNYTSI